MKNIQLHMVKPVSQHVLQNLEAIYIYRCLILYNLMCFYIHSWSFMQILACYNGFMHLRCRSRWLVYLFGAGSRQQSDDYHPRL